MARLTRQELTRAEVLVKQASADDTGPSDEAVDLVERALADVLEQAQSQGLEALSRPRRLLLGLCELHIGVSTEGLAFTLLNGWNLLPAMREACAELKLAGALDVLERGVEMVPPNLLSETCKDEDAEAWLESLGEPDLEAFEDLEDELLDAEPPEGYPGVALKWIVRHGRDFA